MSTWHATGPLSTEESRTSFFPDTTTFSRPSCQRHRHIRMDFGYHTENTDLPPPR